MSFTEMKIQGAWIHNPLVHPDNRGTFREVFKISEIEKQIGRSFSVKQVNQSASHKGVIRGIHFTEPKNGQMKFVTCVQGRIIDIIIDFRDQSNTYGEHQLIELNSENKSGVFIPAGVGHGFISLQHDTVVNYLSTSEYDPKLERGYFPLSKDFGINFENIKSKHLITNYTLSKKDSEAAHFFLA